MERHLMYIKVSSIARNEEKMKCLVISYHVLAGYI